VFFALTVKKRSTVRGEICSTMPRLTASSASSRGVQLLTGRSAASGFSQASAMICMNCSNVKVAGAPGRCSSVKSTSMAWLSSFGFPAASMACNRDSAACQRSRQRRTVS